MNARVKLLLLTGIVVTMLGLSACMTGLGFLGGGMGSLRIQVTDSPFPIDQISSAVVTITRVDVRTCSTQPAVNDDDDDLENASTDATGDEGDEDDGSFITVMNEERSLELLDLRNGRTDLLMNAVIPEGCYNQVRLVVTQGTIILVDGRTFNLKVPSGQQSGIKLNVTFHITAGELTTLLLDVDLSRAFTAIPAGNNGTINTFHFHPAFGMRLIQILDAGSIAGVVVDANADPVAGAAVTAYDQSNVQVTSTLTDPDGTFTLMGLHAGTYRLEVEAAGFQAQSVTDIEVTAGVQTSGVVVTLTPQ